MKEGLRSISAAIGIFAGCTAFWFGARVRDRVDVGPSNLSAENTSRVPSSWLASRSSEVNVPAIDYYSQMVSLLKKYYVEPIKDEDKLASGSVRGMVGSLGDPQSLFMDPSEFHAYLNRQKGDYEGVGVDLALKMGGKKGKSSEAGIQPTPADPEEAVATLSRFPRVVVVAVVPGSPADKAGVKIGDSVADVDGHWVVDEALLDKFKRANRAFVEKKITFSQIEPLQKDLRQKTQRALMPVKTLAKLMTGTSGQVSVVWSRDGNQRTTKLSKTSSMMPRFMAQNGKVVLPMSETSLAGLKKAIAGKDEVTLDLQNDSEGSFSAMLGCLQLLAPSGKYGQIVSQRADGSTPITVESGNPRPPKINILVNRATRGPAEILALALSSSGRAKLMGQEMGGDLSVKQDVELPDGAGYDLVIGTYHPGADVKPPKRGSVALLDSSSNTNTTSGLMKQAWNSTASMLQRETEKPTGGSK